MPNKSVIKAVVDAASRTDRFPFVRVLDLSCGDGKIISMLSQMGCEAEGTQFRDDDYIYHSPQDLSHLTLHKHIDLTQPLPFSSEQYDIVIATEVLEHLPSHPTIISEAGRLLRPGGTFILTTPNIHQVASRIRFSLTGHHDLHGARLGWHIPPSELYSTHFNPVYFPVMHTLLHHASLSVESIGATRIPLHHLFLIAAYPLLAVTTALETRHFIKRSRNGGYDLFRWMIHPSLLLSEQILIVAKKEIAPRNQHRLEKTRTPADVTTHPEESRHD